MKKLMNKIRKSNLGFTLVELIIVVAIIAVLTAVLAPQYLKYVDKSKIAADEDLISRTYSAMQVALVDSDYALKTGDKIEIDSNGIKITAATGSKICEAMNEYFGVTFTSGTSNSVEKLEKYQSATFTVAEDATTHNLSITQAITK